jgi:hypothetical protein
MLLSRPITAPQRRRRNLSATFGRSLPPNGRAGAWLVVWNGVTGGQGKTSSWRHGMRFARAAVGYLLYMASQRQTDAARRNVKKAVSGAKAKRSIANLSKATRTALGRQGAAVAQRKRTGASSPKTRAELYQEAKRRDIPGRSRMGRAQLARALGHR